jgi:hypothetical protein
LAYTCPATKYFTSVTSQNNPELKVFAEQAVRLNLIGSEESPLKSGNKTAFAQLDNEQLNHQVVRLSYDAGFLGYSWILLMLPK